MFESGFKLRTRSISLFWKIDTDNSFICLGIILNVLFWRKPSLVLGIIFWILFLYFLGVLVFVDSFGKFLVVLLYELILIFLGFLNNEVFCMLLYLGLHTVLRCVLFSIIEFNDIDLYKLFFSINFIVYNYK